MAYIGAQPRLGNFQACDAISVVNGQAAYTLQVGGVNISPQSAQHCLVSLNGVLQAPISSYTISSSTLTFASNLATGDSIDFVTILGDTLDLGHPSDDTVKTASLQANAVTGAKLNTDVISAQTALTAEPADTDEFLVSDAGTLKRIDYSLIKGGGITEADQWRLTGGFTSSQDPISSNLERVDDATWGKLGTGMSVSSGIFSFPSTGLWLVKGFLNGNTYDDNYTFNIFGTADNSSYDQLAYANGGNNYSDTDYFQITLETLFNCTDVSTHKVKFTTDGMAGSGNTQVFVSSTANITYFSFTRLGDSV